MATDKTTTNTCPSTSNAGEVVQHYYIQISENYNAPPREPRFICQNCGHVIQL